MSAGQIVSWFPWKLLSIAVVICRQMLVFVEDRRSRTVARITESIGRHAVGEERIDVCRMYVQTEVVQILNPQLVERRSVKAE